VPGGVDPGVVDRVVTSPTSGLTSAEVTAARERGDVNTQPTTTSRSYAQIVRANVLTRFNAIITVLAAVVLVVGSPIDAIFAGVMVANIVIGIVQEIRAKWTLDELRILVTPTVTVIRDGTPAPVTPGELVLGDVVELRSGDQVPVDGTILVASELEVDESALTGESDAIAKTVDDEVRSGSAVVAGSAVVRADAVGADAWVYQLVVEAKQFVLATSELRRGVDRILQLVGWIIGPLAALLLWSQLRAGDTVEEGLVAAVAGVVGLVPQGLVLLVSMALAVAVIRLGQQHVVVQELHAVEGLARVDVLCVDKTGTLTTGAMRLDRVESLDGDDGTADAVARALAALAAHDPSPTSTLRAAAGATPPPDWRLVERAAFSSERKWSGATFDPAGTWLVGAPEVLIEGSNHPAAARARDRLRELTEDARRVVLVARSQVGLGGDGLPDDVEPVALVVLSEEVRSDAAETMRYFADQHVRVVVISGDNPATVSTVAQRLGMPDADRWTDMRAVTADAGPDVYDGLVVGTAVFGRVQPHQKRELVAALQRAGHTVAMTGDGVNDIPALKQADMGIGMDTATAATKAVSQLVLLDGRFDRLPGVVAEGRRVITNMERVSSLFVTKTVYAAVFALVVGLSTTAFPFLPRHMSLVSEVTIGIPAFALSFRSASRPYRPGYLRRVAWFAVPAGLAVATVTLVGYGLARSWWLDLPLDEARTAATITLMSMALWVLYLLVRPVDQFDALVLGGMIALSALIVGTPIGQAFYDLDWPPARESLLLAAYVLACIALLTLLKRFLIPSWSRISARGEEHRDQDGMAGARV
jgi:cation-transporting P-type ATPase E